MRVFLASMLVACSMNLSSGVHADEISAAYDEARECALVEDYDCAFEILILHAETVGMPMELENGRQTISGAMLEASLLGGFRVWDAERSASAARRYLAYLETQSIVGGCCFASGHFVLASTCSILEQVDCTQDSIDFLCASAARLQMPMGRHPRFEDISSQLLTLLNGCEA